MEEKEFNVEVGYRKKIIIMILSEDIGNLIHQDFHKVDFIHIGCSKSQFFG